MTKEKAEEILKQHLGEELYNELDNSFIYPQPSGRFPITDLLKSAMIEASNYTYEN